MVPVIDNEETTMFKRTILAAIAVSMIAVPMAQAQGRHDAQAQHRHYSQPTKPKYQAPKHRYHAERPAPQRHHWKQGQRMPDWRKRQHVRDYQRHGLKRPGKGQQWVRVDNDYLLISLATGVILGLTLGR